MKKYTEAERNTESTDEQEDRTKAANKRGEQELIRRQSSSMKYKEYREQDRTAAENTKRGTRRQSSNKEHKEGNKKTEQQQGTHREEGNKTAKQQGKQEYRGTRGQSSSREHRDVNKNQQGTQTEEGSKKTVVAGNTKRGTSQSSSRDHKE